VTILTFRWNFIFVTVGLLYAIKIVATFYSVQYKHMKQNVVGCAFVFAFNLLGVCSCQKLAKLNEIWQKYCKIKWANFF